MGISRLLFFTLVLWAGFFVRADEVPVAPLSRVEAPEGFSLYDLRAEGLRVEVDPSGEGLMRVSDSKEGFQLGWNLTRILPALQTIPRPQDEWDARGWKTSEGAKVVLLSRRFPPPQSCSVTHVVTLGNGRLDWVIRYTALSAQPERELPFGLDLSLPERAGVLLPSETGGVCGGWAEAGVAARPLAVMPREGRLWVLRGSAAVEEGEELPTAVRREEGGGFLHFQYFPTEELPPMGWTLVAEVHLEVIPLTEDKTLCGGLSALLKDG